jgi:RNA polymerase sigma-70 factor (ECF subfamily)
MVIALRYLEDLSIEEVADRLDLPLGTVKSRLRYALNALRASYAAVERAGGSHRDG